jgi:hypothetical protein
MANTRSVFDENIDDATRKHRLLVAKAYSKSHDNKKCSLFARPAPREPEEEAEGEKSGCFCFRKKK